MELVSSFKEWLKFSREDDVEEYMDRVFKSALPEEAYNFLKGISVISTFDSIKAEEIDIFKETLSEGEVNEILGELIDTNIVEWKEGKLFWCLEQLQDAVFIKAGTEGYRLAHQYYQKRCHEYKKKEIK